ncbi:MAG: aminoacyl-tRNA hydrolase [Acidimicrobiales bacterium]
MFRGTRSGTPSDYLVIGLGNPGAEYEGTRHNAGADAVALVAARHGVRLRAGKEQALVGEVRLGDQRVALAFPQTYMNDSGRSASALVRRYGIEDLTRVLIVHDELDLPVGRIQLKAGGGIAGHNGLRSLRDHLHTTDFLRIRIGVGRPPGRQEGANYVLRRPGKAERAELEIVVQEAADAIEAIVAEGIQTAMTRFNRKPPPA